MKLPEPIDLAALKREAESIEGKVAVVERAWLARVHQELEALRKIAEHVGEVFGLPPGTTL